MRHMLPLSLPLTANPSSYLAANGLAANGNGARRAAGFAVVPGEGCVPTTWAQRQLTETSGSPGSRESMA